MKSFNEGLALSKWHQDIFWLGDVILKVMKKTVCEMAQTNHVKFIRLAINDLNLTLWCECGIYLIHKTHSKTISKRLKKLPPRFNKVKIPDLKNVNTKFWNQLNDVKGQNTIFGEGASAFPLGKISAIFADLGNGPHFNDRKKWRNLWNYGCHHIQEGNPVNYLEVESTKSSN